jgi:hypothetical protein
MKEAPAWVGVTYLLYCAILIVVVIGGTGYAVFVLGHSGWWVLAAVAVCGLGWRPAKWHGLFDGSEPPEKK